MGIALSFLSGKGGSGKTTFSLCIADLLSRSRIKTLLVDCDIGTNGASYFLGTKMLDLPDNQKLTSFFDIITNKTPENGYNPIEIRPYMDFLPSVPYFQDAPDTDEIDWRSNELAERIRAFIEWAKNTYEIVLFDCQSGFTSLFPRLLPYMDVDLFLLETDAVTAAATRKLYLRIGQYLGNAELYQVFNKASEDDYKIYSKIVATTFTNIGTVLFDRRIRQAFSRMQMPNIENTSHRFCSDLIEICRTLLCNTLILQKFFSDRLKLMEIELNIRKLKAEQKEVEQKLSSGSGEKTQSILRFGFLYLSLILAGLTFYLLYKYFTYFKTIIPSTYDSAVAGVAFFLFVISVSSFFFILSSILSPESRNKLFIDRILSNKLDDKRQQISDLKNEQKSIMRKIDNEQKH